MEAMSGLTGSDALSVMNATRGGNYDCYGDGMYGGWFWIIIILFAFWGNNGFGNRDNNVNENLDTHFIERDIFNTNQNVSTTGCQTQRDILENRFTNQLCCCETQKDILLGNANIQKDILLGNQSLSSQMAQCCCDLRTAIHAEGEATRNMIQEDKIQQLRDQVTASNLALNSTNLATNIVNQLRPYPTPAYITCSPYESAMFGRFGFNAFNNGCCGCGNSVII